MGTAPRRRLSIRRRFRYRGHWRPVPLLNEPTNHQHVTLYFCLDTIPRFNVHDSHDHHFQHIQSIQYQDMSPCLSIRVEFRLANVCLASFPLPLLYSTLPTRSHTCRLIPHSHSHCNHSPTLTRINIHFIFGFVSFHFNSHNTRKNIIISISLVSCT
jgi:hypothetical protein